MYECKRCGGVVKLRLKLNNRGVYEEFYVCKKCGNKSKYVDNIAVEIIWID